MLFYIWVVYATTERYLPLVIYRLLYAQKIVNVAKFLDKESQMGRYCLGYVMGMIMGWLFGLSAGVWERVEIYDGTYDVIASGKEVRLLKSGDKLIILKGKEAEKVPKDGQFKKTTTVKSEAAITVTPPK